MTSEIDEISRVHDEENSHAGRAALAQAGAWPYARANKHRDTLLREVYRLRGCGEIDNPLCITVYPHEVYDPSGTEWKARAEAAERKLAKVLEGLDKCVPKLGEMIRIPNREWVADEHNAAIKALQAIIKEARDE